MRYLLVLACFASVLSFTACTFDDGKKTTDDGATAVAGQDIILDIGVAKVVISGSSIGAGTGQIPPGSKVKLEIVDDEILGRNVYSPVVQVSIRDDDGDPVTGLNLSPVAVFEISYDYNTAIADGNIQTDLSLLKIDGTTTDELTYTVLSPVADTEYTLAWPGRARCLVSAFSKFAVADGGDGGTPTTPTALTGTVSTVLTSTVFTLASTGAVFNVNVAIPTSLTTTPPAVITMNDASFNASNPLDPNNRAVTVQTAGVTYTSDAAAANVVMQLNTFTGAGSSGSLIGTVVQQGGSNTLGINFTFTTGTTGATAIGGTVTELAGRRTLSLQDGGSTLQLLALMPDTLPATGLAPIVFNDASFDSGNPSDPAGRILTVTQGGTTYSSDVPVVGSVTMTFTSFNPTPLVGAGTVTGTVVSATPSTLTLNYTFTTTAGGAGGSGTFTAGTAVNVTTTDVADEAVVTFDAFSGGRYIALWMSDVGTTNRTLEMTDLNTTTLVGTTLRSYEPTAALVPAGGLGIATDNFQNLAITGATGSNPGTSSVAAIFYDFTAGALNTAEVNLGTGSAPRVSYHADNDSFVFAWQSGANVMAQVFDFDGDPIGAAVTALTGATLKGLAASGNTSDEALITADDGSGIVGIYLQVSTGTVPGASFTLSTSLSGGLCVWDQVGDRYVVLFQQLVGGFFTTQVLLTLASSTTTPVGAALTLAAAAAPTQTIGGNAGAIFSEPAANMYPAETSATGAELVADPIYGQITGLDLDVTADGGGLGAAGSNNYVLIAARGAAGVTVIPLTLTP
jgi:hypothetical protein